MSKPKPLYIASSLKDLNAKSVYKDGGRSIRTHISFADKAFDAGEEALKVSDEERAYVLFMKYLDIIKKVRKLPEYKKDPKYYNSLIGNKKINEGLNHAEKLAKNLELRYTIKSEKEIKAKKPEEPQNHSSSISNGFQLQEDFVFPKEKLTSQELYDILYKKRKNVMVMDLRSANDFKASHIRHDYCINVPSDVIKPGCTPSKVEKGIDKEHFDVWNSRDSVDLIVLVDWTSKLSRVEELSDPLRSLKDCIHKWDQIKILKRNPVVLEGGYIDFLDAFPQYSTNPQVKVPSFKAETKNVNSLLDFDYSDLRQSMKPVKVDAEVKTPPVKPTSPERPKPSSTQIPPTKSNDRKPETLTNGFCETSATGLYPSLTSASVKPTVQSTNESYVSDRPMIKPTVPKTQPKFDRSMKPKPPTESKPQNENQQSPTFQPQRKATPEHKKPNVRIQHPPPVDHSDTISEMERRIAEMEEVENAKQSDLKQIEQQQKIAELKAKEAEIKRRNEELERKTKKVEKDLAATMRGLAKPATDNQKSETTNGTPVNSLEDKKKDDVATENTVVSSNSENPEPETPINQLDAKPSLPKSANNSEPTSKPIVKSEPASTSALDIKPSNISSNIQNVKPQSAAILPTVSRSEPAIGQKTPSQDKSTSAAAPIDPEKVSVPPKSVVENVDRSVKPMPQAPAPKQPPTIQSQPKPNITVKPVQKMVTKPSKPQITRSNTPPSGGFGLKRSSSSPNIAKMVQDEASVNKSKQPTIPNRVSKPHVLSIEASNFEATLDRSLQGVYGGHDAKALCGLRNLGNSCYMNSTLQCLFNTSQLAHYVLKFGYRKDINRRSRMGSGGKVAEGFSVLLRAVWNAQYRFIVPRDFKNIIGSVKPMFLKTTQEDAQEFLMCLLDELHEDLNRKGASKYIEEPDNDKLSDVEAAQQAWEFHKQRNESIVVELFSGQFRAILQCVACGKTSRKFDTFMYLSLPLPQHQANIYDVINSFTKVELLHGSDQWFCPNCKAHRDAKRTIQIWKLPPVLIIHFKRFVSSGQWLDKIHTTISYPITGLDLARFIKGPKKRNPYDLYAVSHHQGPGLDSGHYTATCKNSVNQCWYKFDDTEVFACSAPSGPTSFILFYSCYPRAVPA